jgi:hypothetical protein
MSCEHGGSPAIDHQAGTRRVFVVHLRLDADPGAGLMAGRIQHVHSGDALHFESVDELVTFITERVAAKPD